MKAKKPYPPHQEDPDVPHCVSEPAAIYETATSRRLKTEEMKQEVAEAMSDIRAGNTLSSEQMHETFKRYRQYDDTVS